MDDNKMPPKKLKMSAAKLAAAAKGKGKGEKLNMGDMMERC